jgi:hypothetical protein
VTEATIKKLNLWSCRVANRELDSLPFLSDFLATNDDELSSNIIENIKQYLDSSALKLREYFPSCGENNNLMKTPFLVTENSLSVK